MSSEEAPPSPLHPETEQLLEEQDVAAEREAAQAADEALVEGGESPLRPETHAAIEEGARREARMRVRQLQRDIAAAEEQAERRVRARHEEGGAPAAAAMNEDQPPRNELQAEYRELLEDHERSNATYEFFFRIHDNIEREIAQIQAELGNLEEIHETLDTAAQDYGATEALRNYMDQLNTQMDELNDRLAAAMQHSEYHGIALHALFAELDRQGDRIDELGELLSE